MLACIDPGVKRSKDGLGMGERRGSACRYDCTFF